MEAIFIQTTMEGFQIQLCGAPKAKEEMLEGEALPGLAVSSKLLQSPQANPPHAAIMAH
jgi:hypothetical protein